MADYVQYQKTSYPNPLPAGFTPSAAQLAHYEDGLAALSAQIIALTAAVADLSATASVNKYPATYLPTY